MRCLLCHFLAATWKVNFVGRDVGKIGCASVLWSQGWLVPVRARFHYTYMHKIWLRMRTSWQWRRERSHRPVSLLCSTPVRNFVRLSITKSSQLLKAGRQKWYTYCSTVLNNAPNQSFISIRWATLLHFLLRRLSCLRQSILQMADGLSNEEWFLHKSFVECSWKHYRSIPCFRF